MIGCFTCQSLGLLGGPWPFKAAKVSRPSAVSLKVWLRETSVEVTGSELGGGGLGKFLEPGFELGKPIAQWHYMLAHCPQGYQCQLGVVFYVVFLARWYVAAMVFLVFFTLLGF